MIVLWALLLLAWVVLALHYLTSYREWKAFDRERRAEREAERPPPFGVDG